MGARVSVRVVGLVCMVVLSACGEPATVPADVSASFPETTTSTQPTVVPFARSPTATATTPTTAGSDIAPTPPVPDRSDLGLQGAPRWFDFEQVITILDESGEAFDVMDVSTYRFRSRLTLVVEGEQLSPMELMGEATKEPAATHTQVTGPGQEGESPAPPQELIMIDGQAWTSQGYGMWEELSSPPSYHPMVPFVSYDVAATAAADVLKRADALRGGTVTVVGEEVLVGLDVLHLQASFEDATFDVHADIWIAPTGLVVSSRYVTQYHNSGDSNEMTWDIYDLGADIEIQPPVP